MRDIPPGLAALVVWCLIVVVLFGFGYTVLPHQQTPRIEAQQEANRPLEKQNKTERNNEPAHPPSLKPVTAQGGDKSGDDAKSGTEEGTEYWPSILGYRLKVTDSMLALFTFALCVIGYVQARKLESTVAATKDLIDTTVGLEMPKVRIDGAIIRRKSDFPMVDNQPQRLKAGRIEIVVSNHGKTPAFIRDWLINMETTNSGLPSDPMFAGRWSTKRDLDMPTILAGSRETLTVENAAEPPLSNAQIDKVLKGEDLLLIWGMIRFEDYEGRAWQRGFALQWEPDGFGEQGEGCLTYSEPNYNFQRLERPLHPAWHDRWPFCR